MIPTVAQMQAIAGGASSVPNINSIITALQQYGPKFGLDVPHRLAQFLAQLCEESGGWKWDKELASGKEYEGRKDLGNTAPGDGVKFKGRTPGQITGRANYRAFTKWCRDNIAANCPDFEAKPELLNTDPWEGLGPIWFWATHSLNQYADQNDIETITKRWNGGLNGYDVRLKSYTRTALVLLGYGPDDVAGFQKWAQGQGLLPKDVHGKPSVVDGDAGPKTRSALHMALSKQNAFVVNTVKPAPVTNNVETTVAVEVKGPPKGVADAATGAGLGVGGLGGIIQQLQQQLTPFSAAGGWITKLVIILIVAGAVLTLGGLAYRYWASREKKKILAAAGAQVVTK